jgi:hypothetical protein
MNFRPNDLSSFWYYPHKKDYLFRIFKKDSFNAVTSFVDENRILNFMTHSNTGFASSVFEAFEDRLVYVRLTRCPMSEYMLNHIANWTKRWDSDIRSSVPQYLFNNNKKNYEYVPYFIKKNMASEFLDASPIKKAILTLKIWQTLGNIQIDEVKKKYNSTIVEIPFEKFVFEPVPYIKTIANAIGSNMDKITHKEMGKQGVPRKSLTDSPRIHIFETLGWKKPIEHLSVEEELEKSRKLLRKEMPKKIFEVLDQIYQEYDKRHNILNC